MAAGRRREVAREFAGRVSFVRRSFLLLPGVGQRPVYDDYVISHRRAARERAPDLGFAIPEPGHPYPQSSLPAQQLALRVEATHPDRLEALEEALFRAVFTDLADTADADVLRRCAVAAGIPETEVAAALADDALAASARRQHGEALERGINGIPALLVPGRAPFVGAVPSAACRAALQDAIAARKPE